MNELSLVSSAGATDHGADRADPRLPEVAPVATEVAAGCGLSGTGVRKGSRVAGVVCIALLSSLALAFLAIWAWIEFGSISAALAYARGARLLPDAFAKSFGTLETGEERRVVFSVSNRCGRQINILGARTSCTCISAEALPLVVPPGYSRPLQLTVRSASRLGTVNEKVLFYTDYPRQLRLVLSVTGRVIPPGSRTGARRRQVSL